MRLALSIDGQLGRLIMAKTLGEEALVLGGSMAGLLAARALSPFFDQVTLVDRDPLAADPGLRKGVPQANHVHVLLTAGERAIDGLFPGLFERIEASGGLRVDMSEENNWFHFGSWKRRFYSGLSARVQSRPLLEREVRRSVFGLPNVRSLRASLLRVDWATDRPRVVLADREGAGQLGGEVSLSADLLVDAMGRGSPLPGLLSAQGRPAPQEETVRVHVHYTSARFRPQAGRDWRGILIYPKPPHERRAGAVVQLEGGELLVSLFGWCGEAPPADDAGFLEFARSLPQPEIAQMLSQAARTGDYHSFSYKEAKRRNYPAIASDLPQTIVVGDALCSVDPVFGQGMSLAALEAQCLERTAGHVRSVSELTRNYWSQVPGILKAAWMMSTSEDLRYPEVEGSRGFGLGFLHWYTARIHALTAYDDEVYVAFAKAMHLVRPPESLFAPRILLKVCREALFPKARVTERPTVAHPSSLGPSPGGIRLFT